MGPFEHIDIAASMGPFKIIDRITRWWLWAHSRISTEPLGGGYGPIQERRHRLFGGPIQEHRQNHSVVAVGPFENIEIADLMGPF